MAELTRKVLTHSDMREQTEKQFRADRAITPQELTRMLDGFWPTPSVANGQYKPYISDQQIFAAYRMIASGDFDVRKVAETLGIPGHKYGEDRRLPPVELGTPTGGGTVAPISREALKALIEARVQER